LLEGQLAEAEAAVDKALAFQADSFLALKWKAIIAAQTGNEEVAKATIRRLREVEPEISIDQHVRQMVHWPKLAERSDATIATLRRLWDETGGDG
jgi:hypothetical protein